jgi:hypothetical protein
MIRHLSYKLGFRLLHFKLAAELAAAGLAYEHRN